ncbi:MAG: nucleotidyltransferase domain-containing protein [Nanoarchaeota archaeon]|nr:nucleotidyltransferase domain-containing protein [Nanoarchaeota archaeon]
MEILGTKTGLKILKILIENPLYEFKEIEIINKAGTGKGSASNAINSLIKRGIVKEKRIGKAKIISLNIHNNSSFLIKELFSQDKLSKMEEKRLASLILFSEEIKEFSDLIVVFGSSLAGTQHKESDIDVLIKSNNMNKIQTIRKRIEELFNIKFNLHMYKEKEEFTQNAVLNGALIHGFEDAKRIFSGIKPKNDMDRLFFFKERINSIIRNYNNKDTKTSESIMESLLEQMIFYILSEKNIKYESKKDALKSIKDTKEGKTIEKILKSPFKTKINLTEDLIMSILTNKILENEGY